jgi:cell division protein FtsI/penicillin-binding protein 2
MGVKIALGIATIGVLGAAYYRSLHYMTPEREKWIVSGKVPADSVSTGFDTKSRFRSLAQPLGRILDRNGTLMAGYLYDGHLRRSYPAGPAMAHLIGYWTGPLRDGVGLEKGLTLVNDSLADDLPHDLTLSIDLRLQRDALAALGGKAGAIVVMDARNGEVLAAANYPTYDPRDIWNDTAWARLVRDTVRRPLIGRALKDNFSPGSSIKPFIAAAALHADAPLPEERRFFCGGSYQPAVRVRPITDHGTSHGAIDIVTAMGASCNIYFSHLAYDLLGFDRAEDYFEAIGFNERLRWNTGAFLNQYNTLLPALSWVRARDEIAKTRLGIGQAAVKMNPIHMTTLIAGFANGGRFMRPALELGRPADTIGWRFDTSLAGSMETLLRAPILPGGTAAGIFNDVESKGVMVFGKTGTADPEPDGREPSWFISYGRKGGRVYAVVVAIQNRERKYASVVNAPMARRMYEALLRYGYYQ